MTEGGTTPPEIAPPETAQPGRFLCRRDEIPEGGGRGFWFGRDVHRFGVFVLRRGTAIVAYVNSCPHRGTPLDFQPDRFLDITRRFIQCSTHGALFRIDDGVCVGGPCLGAALAPASITEIGDALYLSSDPAFE